MLIGYARVSTDEQNLDLQIDELRKIGCGKIFQDTASGKAIDRQGLAQAIDYARSGDTLVIWRLDRLGRSLKELIELVQTLNDRGIGLRSLHEQLDTTTAAGKLIYHVFDALAEFERNLIIERTQAGLAAARVRGRNGGRPKKLDEQQIKEIQALMQSPEISASDIAKRYGVLRGTLYNIHHRNLSYNR